MRQIITYRQIDINGQEIASYWSDNLDSCITSVTLKESNNNVKYARELLESYTRDLLSIEELNQIEDKPFIYKGWYK